METGRFQPANEQERFWLGTHRSGVLERLERVRAAYLANGAKENPASLSFYSAPSKAKSLVALIQEESMQRSHAFRQ